MSHKYDTVSRAAAENDVRETTILAPTASDPLSKLVWPVSAITLMLMLVSGLLCVTALSVASVLYLEGAVRGDNPAKDTAIIWATVGCWSIVIGWGVSLVGFLFLVLREKVARNV